MSTRNRALIPPESVEKIVAEQLGVERSTVTREKSFVADLGADSLDMIEIVMAVEDEYGLEIPDDDAEKWQTVGDVSAYIATKGTST